VARSKPKQPTRTPSPDELIKAGKDGRIRLIETRKRRRPIIQRKGR
jgi:hypothetical protein